jgi:transposase
LPFRTAYAILLSESEGITAADYGRNLYKQYEEELAKNESLAEANKALKREIMSMKRNRDMDVSAAAAEHRKEIKALEISHAEAVGKLTAVIERLEEEVRKLRAMIDKNSSNSSKPPSSDGFKKPTKTIPNTRQKSGRKPGGQKGHKGNIPILFENPDETEDLRKDSCECGGKIDYADGSVRKQVVEIVFKTHVKEYIGGNGVCSVCGKKHRARFPDHAHNPVNMGDGLKALAATLNVEYAMPLNKIGQFVSDMTEGRIRMTDGTIVNACKELGRRAEPSIESIKDKLFLSPVLHKDETGVRVNGKQHWIHTLTAGDFAYYHCDENRGNEADKAMGVLTGYRGTLVHDHLKGLYAWDCGHAECNAHLLRYLIYVIENEPEYAAHAKAMLKLFVDANNERKEAKQRGEEVFEDKTIKKYEKKYDRVVKLWEKAILKISEKTKGKKGRYKREGERLCPRLALYKDEHLLFIRDFSVPFDNNAAERALRGIKSKTKMSGGFRTPGGGDVYARLRSYAETLRRHKMNILTGMASALAGDPVVFE